ncbi:MAG: hypothetical protein ACRCU3_00300 [Eubacteriaceae bacterium]
MSMIGCHSVNTAIKIRDELVKNNLIYYEKGKKGIPNNYIILIKNLEDETTKYPSKFELKEREFSSKFDMKPELKTPINSSKFDTKTANIYKHKQINNKHIKTDEEKRRDKAYEDLEITCAENPWENL